MSRYLENFLKQSQNLHFFEDWIRQKLVYSNDVLTYGEKILIARIMCGRINNAKKIGSGLLDGAHSKAQMITILCLCIYLDRITTEDYDIYFLVKYHISKVQEYVEHVEMKIIQKMYVENIKYYYILKEYLVICHNFMLGHCKIDMCSIIPYKPSLSEIFFDFRAEFHSLKVNDFIQ